MIDAQSKDNTRRVHDRTRYIQLGKTLWSIADPLRGAMNAGDFRDYMLAFLFLRYLAGKYEQAARRELGQDYPKGEGDNRRVPLAVWHANTPRAGGGWRMRTTAGAPAL